jgi:DNA-binding NarL/FixJ family response regulator
MRIVIVDDHIIYREGLKRVLASVPDCEVVGEAGSARAAFRVVDKERPDLVILDMLLPGMDGCSAARELKRRSPEARVLVLTACDGADDMRDAFSAGAAGYLLKSDPIPTLVEALHAVQGGGRFLSPALAARSEQPSTGPTSEESLACLSVREREVFHLAISGLSNAEMSRDLRNSRKTVETHTPRPQKKLRLTNTNRLLRFAAHRGFIRRARRVTTETPAAHATNGSTPPTPGDEQANLG